jgi:hypothetical protein
MGGSFHNEAVKRLSNNYPIPLFAGGGSRRSGSETGET